MRKFNGDVRQSVIGCFDALEGSPKHKETV